MRPSESPRDPAADALVFGYGSLVTRQGFTPSRTPDPRGLICDLVGFRRRYGVAMENARTRPGYKYYVTPGTRERPPVQVAFLDLVESPGGSVNGLAFPVSGEELAALGRRERNYVRVEVTDALRPAPPVRAWAFLGSVAARRRFELGREHGTLVVASAYAALVEHCFEALGAAELERYRRSTDPPPCPLIDLERVDVPAAPPAARPARR